MIGRGGILGALALLVLSTIFAARNGARVVTVDVGFATLERLPLPVVVFGAVLLGMLVMLAAGVHSDLKVRTILKARLTDEGRREREWRDRNQQDLFAAQDQGPEGQDQGPEGQDQGPEGEAYNSETESVTGPEEDLPVRGEIITAPEGSLTAPESSFHQKE